MAFFLDSSQEAKDVASMWGGGGETSVDSGLGNTSLGLSTGSISGLFGAAGGVAQGIGSLVGGFMQQGADEDAASAFTKSAKFFGDDEQYAKMAGGIRELSAAREIQRTIGAQRAGVAAGGFADSGSALSIVSDSVRQGALAEGSIRLQTALNVNSYEQQRQSALNQADAAHSAGDSAMIGGIFGFLGGAAKAAGAILPLL